MHTFVEVVSSGSFTRAAERLLVPKARVSQRIQALGAAVGVRLLERTTRALRITDDGRLYYERCVKLLADIEQTEQALRGDHAQPHGILRVDSVAAIARHVLAPSLVDFGRLFPDVVVHLYSRDRISHLLEDGIDCAIRGGTLPDASSVARNICNVHLGMYASPSFLESNGTPHKPEDLMIMPRLGWLDQRGGGIVPWYLDCDDSSRFEVTGTPIMSFDDGDAAIAASLGGAGVVVAAPFAVKELVCSGRLKPVLPQWEVGQREVNILLPSSHQLSSRVRCFVDWVVDRLRLDPLLNLRPRDLGQ